jgi:hypothetical protein
LATPDAKSVVKVAHVRRMDGHSCKVWTIQFYYCLKTDTDIAYKLISIPNHAAGLVSSFIHEENEPNAQEANTHTNFE